jgi:hypothetical protein
MASGHAGCPVTLGWTLRGESAMCRFWISSARLRVNGRVIGQLAVESRVIHFTKAFFSAADKICSDSCAVERGTRLESW